MVDHLDYKIEFRKIVEKHWNKFSSQIFRLCQYKCANADEARDLYQTVALKFFENIQDLAMRDDVKPWLLVVVRNSFLDILAERKRMCLMSSVRDNISEYMGFREEEGAFYANEATPEQRLLVSKMLGLLNPCERIILEMKYSGGFSIKEIGGALGISENAVRKRRVHAFERLRRFYEENLLTPKKAE